MDEETLADVMRRVGLDDNPVSLTNRRRRPQGAALLPRPAWEQNTRRETLPPLEEAGRLTPPTFAARRAQQQAPAAPEPPNQLQQTEQTAPEPPEMLAHLWPARRPGPPRIALPPPLQWLADTIADPHGHERAQARRGPASPIIDLMRPPAERPRPSPLVTERDWPIEQRREYMRLRERQRVAPSLMDLERSRFLAQGALEAEREARRRSGLPATEERRIRGVAMQNVTLPDGRRVRRGEVSYETRPRRLDAITADVERQTGVPAAFLNALIQHESGGRSNARATSSSATGPAQFIDATWLDVMREYGPRYGLNPAATDAEILELRTDPAWAALMAAHYARENQASMRNGLRRDISHGEAYLGHFLGARDAVKLIIAANRDLADARQFVAPASVEANPQIFYEGGQYEMRERNGRRYRAYVGGGRPRSAREVVELQTRRFGRQPLGEPPPAANNAREAQR